MKTVTDQLLQMSAEIKALVSDLLRRCSALERETDTTLFRSSGDHNWTPLNTEGRQLQSNVRNEYGKLLAVLHTLVASQPSSVQDELSYDSAVVYRAIDQEGATCWETTEQALNECHTVIDRQIGLVSRLHDGAEGRHIYVPDTNALLHNPQLEDWEFADSPNFTVILTPTVLVELDHLKVNHRNEDVRRKTEGIIQRIKGYRSRGRLDEGVPLRSGRSTLQSVAMEPNMADSLPWLQANNKDDAILAGLIEIMRAHPRCQVMLVTRDINLQNKAEYARLPFVEPPEP